MTREEAKRILYVYRAMNLVDGSHREAFDMAIKALEQKPCEDCISRQAVIKHLHNEYHGMISDESMKIYEIINMLKEQPPVTPKPRTGHWIKIGTLGLGVKCPFCDGVFAGDKELYNFCPNCGAKMESEGV